MSYSVRLLRDVALFLLGIGLMIALAWIVDAHAAQWEPDGYVRAVDAAEGPMVRYRIVTRGTAPSIGVLIAASFSRFGEGWFAMAGGSSDPNAQTMPCELEPHQRVTGFTVWRAWCPGTLEGIKRLAVTSFDPDGSWTTQIFYCTKGGFCEP